MKLKAALVNLISFALILSFVLPVLADSGGPISYNYDAVVIKLTGTDVHEYDYSSESLSKITDIRVGTKIRVKGEYNIKGKEYVYAVYDLDESGYILMADIRPVDSGLDPKDALKYEKPEEILALKDVPVYTGPAESFKKVGTLPANTIVTTAYGYDWKTNDKNENKERDKEDVAYLGGCEYTYIEYNNIKGWAQYYTPAMEGGKFNFARQPKADSPEVYVYEDAAYYRSCLDWTPDSATIAKAKAGEIIPYSFFFSYISSYYDEENEEYIYPKAYYVEYKGKKCWLIADDNNVCAKDPAILTIDMTEYMDDEDDHWAKQEHRLRNKPDSEETDLCLTPGKTYYSPYYCTGKYAIETDGKLYWVSNGSTLRADEFLEYTTTMDLTYYSEPDEESEAKTLPKGTKLYTFDANYSYPDKFVAVYNGKLIYVINDFDSEDIDVISDIMEYTEKRISSSDMMKLLDKEYLSGDVQEIEIENDEYYSEDDTTEEETWEEETEYYYEEDETEEEYYYDDSEVDTEENNNHTSTIIGSVIIAVAVAAAAAVTIITIKKKKSQHKEDNAQ